MVERGHRLAELAYHSQPELSLEEESTAFIDTWEHSLHDVVNSLQKDGVIFADAHKSFWEEIHEGITAWATQEEFTRPDHGAVHSFFVYEGMKALAEADRRSDDVPDEMMQTLAVLHDLLQHMKSPFSLLGGESDVRKIHARGMALFVRSVGHSLGLSSDETDELYDGIYKHDDVYTGRYFRPKYYSGKLLSDADKLYGAGIEGEPRDFVENIMLRNLQGADKPQGWYLRRDDITGMRDWWMYGDRWYFDALSAVRFDLFNLEFSTEAGKAFAQQRREVLDDPGQFAEIVESVYGQFYGDTAAAMALGMSSDSKVSFVGRGVPENYDSNIKLDLDTIEYAYTHTLGTRSKDADTRGLPEARGLKLLVRNGHEKLLIDPSVARFMFDKNGTFNPELGKEAFKKAVQNALLDTEEDYV